MHSLRNFHWAATTRVIRNYGIGWQNCSISGDDQPRLHIRSTGRGRIIKSGTILPHFYDTFLHTDNVSDGKEDIFKTTIDSSNSLFKIL